MDLKCEDHFKYRGPKKVSVVWSVGDGDIFKRVLLTGASEARIMEFKSKKILRLSVAIERRSVSDNGEKKSLVKRRWEKKMMYIFEGNYVY
ncbi:hypothetical protein MTR_5g020240 [Medicago truncatula]|uniref:Uncharacterized protein n=1 Tax=Medicago truncatula TaxID=3880 RepID=G7KDL2_MEDTR|nr:hypothetical protein MTR_5g020240 [Medicago truncatula]